MLDFGVYGGLFGVAFLAATILPAQSEIGLVALVINDEHSIPLLIAVASIGNTLGAVVNWAIGRGVERFRDKKWFPASPRQLDRATGWYHKYGRWSLLLSWAPFVGDPLTLAAGVLREPFWSFFLLVAFAKTARYIVTAAIAMNWI
ncbi:MAG: DedA family protein [Rhodospirillales bacterium]|nr:DedA family protein [Rhodospirillales bacterium]